MKSSLVAVAIGLFALQGAQATTLFEGEAFLATGPNDSTATAQDLGLVTSLTSLDVFGSRLEALPGFDSADFFKITVTVPTVLRIAVNAPGGPTFDNDPIVGLFDAGSSLIASDDDGGEGFNALLIQPVTADVYYVAVAGYADFSFTGGSSSNYVYSLEVSAVPEPSVYAMMLAGLGVLGFVARRRRG